MNDSELLDWLDQQENLSIHQDEDAYWYIITEAKTYATGYPFIRDAIHVAATRKEHETNSTL